jgi:hypothetical protein
LPSKSVQFVDRFPVFRIKAILRRSQLPDGCDEVISIMFQPSA